MKRLLPVLLLIGTGLSAQQPAPFIPEDHRPRLAAGWAALHARVRAVAEAASNKEDQ